MIRTGLRRVLRLLLVLIAALAGSPAVTAVGAPGLADHLAGGVPIRILTFNGKFGVANRADVAAYVAERRPDIVLLQEAKADWLREPAFRDYPFHRHSERHLVIVSRFPFVDGDRQPAAIGDAPILRAVVDIGLADPLTVFSLHPTSPRLPDGVRRQEADYAAIGRVMAAEPAGSTMIAGGDFNATPVSPLFADLMEATGMTVLAGDTVGIPTRFARELGLPTWIGVAIDHVAGRGPIAFVGRSVGPDLGSDHLPVLVDVVVGGAP